MATALILNSVQFDVMKVEEILTINVTIENIFERRDEHLEIDLIEAKA